MELLFAVASENSVASQNGGRRTSRGLSLIAAHMAAEVKRSPVAADVVPPRSADEGQGMTSALLLVRPTPSAAAAEEAVTVEPPAAVARPRASSLFMLLASSAGAGGGNAGPSFGLQLLTRVAEPTPEPAVVAAAPSTTNSGAPEQQNDLVASGENNVPKETAYHFPDSEPTEVVPPVVPKQPSQSAELERPPLPEPPRVVCREDVIGLRSPQNKKRVSRGDLETSLRRFSVSLGEVPMPNEMSSSPIHSAPQYASHEIYSAICSAYQTHVNSRVKKILQQHDAYTQIPSNALHDLRQLDLSLCMIKDKGLLPIVELIRFMPALETLNLADNDISNEGIEYLAHAVMEGATGSSFEVADDSERTQEEKRDGSVDSAVQRTGKTFLAGLECRFARHLVSLDVSRNRISLGGIRLLQLIAEKLPSLADVKAEGARVDATEIDALNAIAQGNATSLNRDG